MPIDQRHRAVRTTLAALRETLPGDWRPNCYRVHLLLKSIWRNAVAWYDGDHIITEIHGRFYDIDGQVFNTLNFNPISREPRIAKSAHRWARRNQS